MKLVAYLFLMVAVIGTACSDINKQKITDRDTKHINIHLLGDKQVNFEGEIMSIARFETQLMSYELNKNDIVQFKVKKEEVTFGEVTDVQSMLRKKGALKINYLASK